MTAHIMNGGSAGKRSDSINVDIASFNVKLEVAFVRAFVTYRGHVSGYWKVARTFTRMRKRKCNGALVEHRNGWR